MKKNKTADYSKHWNIVAMETSEETYYAAFQKKPHLNVFDSKTYTSLDDALERCRKLNRDNSSIAICRGRIPLNT